jgi:alanine-glyoxylate transaminase / serine-glyoxylate transaminase / serine-pyruvate transaminase
MVLEVANPNLKRADPPRRLLLGAGPQNAHPRVHAALTIPQVGHMDGSFLEIVEETRTLLKYVWQTRNNFTIPISGSASAAWEAIVANLTEPGDIHLIGLNGYFGERAIDMHGRYGADVRTISKAYGDVFTLADIEQGLASHRPKLLWLCHAETSTGTLQPMDGIGELCRRYDCLLLIDTVTSICGSPIYIDRWGVDAAYAGGQKCMGCPPGVSCLTLNDRAIAKLEGRTTIVPNWYLDMTMIRSYLDVAPGTARIYHHTAPISMIYALRESLQLVSEEGLETVWKRHESVAGLLYSELSELRFEMHVTDPSIRTPALTTVKLPEGVDAVELINFLKSDYGIEIANAFGPLHGKVIRIGLMGYNARPDNVGILVYALKRGLENAKRKNSFLTNAPVIGS